MSAAAHLDERVRDRLRAAARWRLTGLLLRRPGPRRRAEIAALARENGDPALAAAARAAVTSEGEYLALLGPGGPVSPREVSYRPLEDPGRLLAELGAFHAAFAYRGDDEDPRDHVAVAADFVGFLALKEAYACAAGRQPDADVTREAAEEFVVRHVRAIARGMRGRLARLPAPGAYLPAALEALGRLAGADAGPDPRDPALDGAAFPRAGLDDGPLDCGAIGPDCEAPCAAARRWPIAGS